MSEHMRPIPKCLSDYIDNRAPTFVEMEAVDELGHRHIDGVLVGDIPRQLRQWWSVLPNYPGYRGYAYRAFDKRLSVSPNGELIYTAYRPEFTSKESAFNRSRCQLQGIPRKRMTVEPYTVLERTPYDRIILDVDEDLEGVLERLSNDGMVPSMIIYNRQILRAIHNGKAVDEFEGTGKAHIHFFINNPPMKHINDGMCSKMRDISSSMASRYGTDMNYPTQFYEGVGYNPFFPLNHVWVSDMRYDLDVLSNDYGLLDGPCRFPNGYQCSQLDAPTSDHEVMVDEMAEEISRAGVGLDGDIYENWVRLMCELNGCERKDLSRNLVFQNVMWRMMCGWKQEQHELDQQGLIILGHQHKESINQRFLSPLTEKEMGAWIRSCSRKVVDGFNPNLAMAHGNRQLHKLVSAFGGLRKAFNKAVKNRERKRVFRRFILEGRSHAWIGKRYGVRRETICRIVNTEYTTKIDDYRHRLNGLKHKIIHLC